MKAAEIARRKGGKKENISNPVPGEREDFVFRFSGLLLKNLQENT